MATTTVHGSQTKLVQIGGALGIAAVFIAIGAFVAACFRFEAALMLSPLPVILGGVGLVLGLVGGVIGKHDGEAETQPIAAVFVCLTGLLGGMLEMALWLGMK